MRKKVFLRYLLILIIISIFYLGIGYNFSSAQDIPTIPTAELPVMITSSGHSPDAFVVKALLDRAKIDVFFNKSLQAEELKDIKTLLIAIGGSAKGLGAAGIDPEEELNRVKNILDVAKEKGILVFGIHIGGEARRGPLSAKFIDLTAPRVQYLIVTEDGNIDGYFTKISEENKIPLFIIKLVYELEEIFKKIFQKNT